MHIQIYCYFPDILIMSYPLPYNGGVTDENAREVSVKLDFHLPGISYEATIYADGPDADFERSPARGLIS